MIPADLPPLFNQVFNHLWQSTLFAAAAGLLTLALRNTHARARYWIWLTASVKFLIPFSLLVGIGSHIEWRTGTATSQPEWSLLMEQVSQPFAAPAVRSSAPAAALPPRRIRFQLFYFAAWTCGFVAVVFSWWLRWRRIHVAAREASPLKLALPIEVMSSPALLEPGVFGIRKPVLLLPEGITDRLTPAQWFLRCRLIVSKSISRTTDQID
jgi:bla regulator protein blaR1